MAAASRRGAWPPNVWLDGSVGMAHVASPGVQESQLVQGEASGLSLCVDGRIDNRAELLARLDLMEQAGRPLSDPDLLLAAYERWGADCPRQVLGDFAFAVWDAKSRALACCRDHFGVRPLYYTHIPGVFFAFASEVHSLLALEGVDAEIEESRVARHLLIPVEVDLRDTYYRNVRKVLPAHALRVSEQGIAEGAYWELDPERESAVSSDRDCADALREVFIEAVRCRMRSADPVAAMLSGGLDSSAIAAVAAGLSPSQTPLHTLSAVYPRVPDSDERGYIDSFLRHFSVSPSYFEADAVNPIADIDEMSRLIGGPSRGRNLYLNWNLTGMAKDAGCGVILDGFDGDSTLSHATNYLASLAIAGRWLELAVALVPLSRRQGSSPWRDLRSYWRFGRRRRAIAAGYAREPDPQVPPTMPINEAFLGRFSRRALSLDLDTSEREMHARHLAGPHLAEVLGWVEACGAGRDVEIRFPFFDVRLAEFCLSLPPRQKLRRGHSRFSMRKAMEGILPPEIQWRVSKGNMHPGWNHAYRSHEEGRVRDLLIDPTPELKEYLDVPRALSLHERFLMGDVSRSDEGAWWRMVSLALWLGSQRDQVDQVERSSGSSSSSRPRSRRSEQ